MFGHRRRCVVWRLRGRETPESIHLVCEKYDGLPAPGAERPSTLALIREAKGLKEKMKQRAARDDGSAAPVGRKNVDPRAH